MSKVSAERGLPDRIASSKSRSARSKRPRRFKMAVRGSIVAKSSDGASQRLPRLERIGSDGLQLIDIPLPGKVRSLAAHVSDSGHGILSYVVLHVKVPLLHVRIVDLLGVGGSAGGAGQAATAQVGVADHVELRGIQNARWVALQPGDAFVPVQVFVEDPVTAADGPFALSLGIEREA